MISFSEIYWLFHGYHVMHLSLSSLGIIHVNNYLIAPGFIALVKPTHTHSC